MPEKIHEDMGYHEGIVVTAEGMAFSYWGFRLHQRGESGFYNGSDVFLMREEAWY